MRNEIASQRERRSRESLYAALGALLGLGAPLGFLALRGALARRVPSPRWAARELSSRPETYAYLGLSTTTAFALFGRLLGRLEDDRRRRERDNERLREEFSAVVSHDLRDPITPILIDTDRLLGSATAGEVAVPTEVLARIRRSALRLAQVTDDFQDVMQIELGRLVVKPRPVALPAAVSALVDKLRPALAPHPVALRVDGHPGSVMADPGRLDQVLRNLMENAAKFSSGDAPIVIAIRSAHGGAVVSVEDRGVGIPPQEMGLLFDRAFQSQRARARRTGLGVGLYITRAIVEAHGGRLAVESEPGRGSTFRVFLPGAPPQLAEAGEQPPTRETVRRYMARRPPTIESGETVAAARSLIREHGVRHLPVVDHGAVVGLLSDSEIASLAQRGEPEREEARVESVMARFPFVVSPEAPVEEAARVMARHGCDVAIVVENGKVVGTLAAVDALRALAEPGPGPLHP